MDTTSPDDLPPDARVGVLLPRDLPAREVIPYARRADELGFSELWTVEDLGFRGGIAQASAVLAATARIRVGIGILPAASRNVAFAAMELATLAELFPGRVDAGVGHGMPAWMRSVGAWPASPLGLLTEYATALRSLLRGETVTSDGRYVRLDGVRLDAAPEVMPGILFGVRAPKSVALSGRLADGTILAEPVTPEYTAEVLAQIGAPSHRVVGYNIASVDVDESRALERARPGLEWVGDPEWAPHIAPLPFADAFAALRQECGSRSEFIRRLPDEWVRRLAVAGTPASARERLAALHRSGITDSVLLPVGSDPMRELGSLAALIP
ncbi:LLM class flavin-dependent oxidoreductase [Lysobacter korlensis]|uniref:LLM class flavin-dependent oxidoreductase n=1 Tax=Lysobacter korlensis TaxID=553636 RepID=A0ABV6S0D1_9GAMM